MTFFSESTTFPRKKSICFSRKCLRRKRPAMSERPSFDELSAQERRALIGKLLQQQRQKAQLSFAQERLWFLQELEPENAAQVVQAAVRLTVALDLTALRRSINEMLRRHEAL